MSRNPPQIGAWRESPSPPPARVGGGCGHPEKKAERHAGAEKKDGDKVFCRRFFCSDAPRRDENGVGLAGRLWHRAGKTARRGFGIDRPTLPFVGFVGKDQREEVLRAGLERKREMRQPAGPDALSAPKGSRRNILLRAASVASAEVAICVRT